MYAGIEGEIRNQHNDQEARFGAIEIEYRYDIPQFVFSARRWDYYMYAPNVICQWQTGCAIH